MKRASLIGGNDMAYVEPISTPIHAQVPPALSKQIWRENKSLISPFYYLLQALLSSLTQCLLFK